MTTFREKLVEDAYEEFERLTVRVSEYMGKLPELKRFIEHIPDLDRFEDANIYLGSFLWPVYVKIPLIDKVQVSEIADLFHKRGWDVDEPDVQSYRVEIRIRPSKYWGFEEYSWKVVVILEKTEETLCKLEKIGEKEELIKTSVYEIVCPEGAQEEAFGG